MSAPPIVMDSTRRKFCLWNFITISSFIATVLVSLDFMLPTRMTQRLHGITEKRQMVDISNGSDQPKSAKFASNITNIDSFHGGSNVIWMYWAQGLEHLMSLGNETGKYQFDSKCVQVMHHMHHPSKSSWVVKLLDNRNVADYAPTFSSMIKNKSLPSMQNRLWSDLLRLELLSLYGGIWTDTSVCPFVPFDEVIPKYLGPEKESFYAPSLGSMSKMKNISTCHLSKNNAAEYRTASTYFMAVSHPHNPLIEEWLRKLVHHLTTLPNPNRPYFISHCSLTQARMYNATVDNIWRSNHQFWINTRNKGRRVPICYDSGSWTLEKLKVRCDGVKRPSSRGVRSFILGEYLIDFSGDAE